LIGGGGEMVSEICGKSSSAERLLSRAQIAIEIRGEKYFTGTVMAFKRSSYRGH